MMSLKEAICGMIAVVILVVIVFIIGLVSGEIIVWVCDEVGYVVDDVMVRSIWVCVFMLMIGVNCKKSD